MAYSVDGLSIGDTLSVEDLKQKNELIWANSVRAIQTGGTAPDGNPEVMIIEAAAGGGGGGGDVTLAEVIVRDTQTLNAAKAYTDAKPGITVVDDLPATIPPDTIIGVTSGNLPPAGGGRKSATLVVGTVLMGHTEADVDILLTGVNDHVLLQEAHDALPSTGGLIMLREGTINLGGGLTISKPNVTIMGMGPSSVFKRMYDETEGNGCITVTGSNCTLCDSALDGNRAVYTSSLNHGIRTTGGSHARFLRLRVYNTSTGIWLSADNGMAADCYIGGTITRGIYIAAGNNSALRNTVESASSQGIAISGAAAVNAMVSDNRLYNNTVGIILGTSAARNAVTGNFVMRGTGLSGDYAAGQHTIQISGSTPVNNFVVNNVILGKDVTNEGGASNTVTGNKFS